MLVDCYLPKTASIAVDAKCNNFASSLLAGACIVTWGDFKLVEVLN